MKLRSLVTCLAILPISGNALAQANGPTDPTPANDNSTWVMTNDLPPDLRANRVEGNVRAELDVDESGRVTACRVAVSSGYPDMDTTTCNQLYDRARLIPARDREGRNVPGVYKTTVVFLNNIVLPDPPEPSDRTLTFIIERDGLVTSCNDTTRIGPDVPNEARCPTGLRFKPILGGDGQPVRVRYEIRQSYLREELPD